MAAELLRPRKRVKVSSNAKENTVRNNARLFVPFRALGLITNHVPFVLQSRSFKGASNGPRLHILTCLGNSWALWEGGKMTLLFVGPSLPDSISSMALDGDFVWVAAGSHVYQYIRGKEVRRLDNPLESRLSNIVIFGSQLLALSHDGHKMLIWEILGQESPIIIEFDPDFTAISLIHPATYLNKILVSSSQGGLQLWNIRSRTCIHKFGYDRITTSVATTKGTSITAITQSPAIDVVGVGYTSGEISVYDIRADERLLRMFMEGGGVSALGFRSDGEPILASASSMGHIALWDLNSGGRLLHMVRGAHDGAISAVEWVPGQPVLVTSGDDNSVKQWLFDSPTSPPRLLKFRSGHSAPPHLIRYHGEDGKQILTASRDRSLRCTSVVRDSRSYELSQGSLSKTATTLSRTLASLKFPPIVSLAYSSTRAKDWDDVLTTHTDETFSRTWTVQGKKLGRHTFGFADGGSKKKGSVGSAKAVCVSACGNFGIASSSTGQIYMWNMQSGIKRKEFSIGVCPDEAANRFKPSGLKKATERSITGIASDALNRLLIASTLDGTINFFDFHTTRLENTLVLPSSVVSIVLHRDSGLLAAVCDDLVVRIVDIETRKVVRELGGHRGRILDITFSPDSRWLITTSLDSIIRTFDVPTGRLIDAFRTSSVATSVSFSPTNDFLATSHVDSVGIYLWANRAQYGEVFFHTILEDDITEVSLPTAQGEAEEEALDALTALTMDDKSPDVFSTPPQLDGDLVTLSLLPRSRWQTLLNLEVIQQRNKPKEAPKLPERAPFFLPTLPGGDGRFVVDVKPSADSKKQSTRRLDKIAAETASVFLTKLEASDPTGDYEDFFSFVKTLSPAAIDLEIRSLLTLESIRLFINALTRRLASHRDFEAVQAFQGVFLRIHAEIIVENGELLAELHALGEMQRRESEKVLHLIASSLGTLAFVRDTM